MVLGISIFSIIACRKEITNDSSADRTVNMAASATVVKSIIDIDLSSLGPVYVPICVNGGAGENLLMQGTLRITSQTTVNDNHFTSSLQFQRLHDVLAIGETTGDTYSSGGGEYFRVNGSFTNGQYITSVIDRFYWFGRGGDAAKYRFNITMHVVTNADGTITASIDKVELICFS